MHWWIWVLSGAAVSVEAGSLLMVRRYRRYHRVRRQLPPAMQIFPEDFRSQVVTQLVEGGLPGLGPGAPGSSAFAIARLPHRAIPAAWYSVRIVPGGDIVQDAGYSRSLRAAKRCNPVRYAQAAAAGAAARS